MRKVKAASLLLVFVVGVSVLGATKIDMSEAKIIVLNPARTIYNKAADMLCDEVEKRTRIRLEIVSKMPGKDEVAIVIGTAKDLAKKSYKPAAGVEVPERADGYALWIDTSKRDAATICTAGYDDRGTLFAVGRLLRVLDMDRDSLKLDAGIKISTAPRYPLRGHQFGYRPKTNSYDGWDIGMWEQYYRDMIVFGMNAIELIPPASDDAEDSPLFPKPKLEMMVAMSQLAADYGLDVWIWSTALEEINGVKIDYSDENSIQTALKECDRVFRELPKIDDVFVPGGDPGNTHPALLLPFMEKEKKILLRYHPHARIWVSPQNFDRKGRGHDGWYKAFIDILQNEQPGWLDGVVFGPTVPVSLTQLRKDVPAKYPIRRYPDITHCRSCPYAVQDWDKAFNDTIGREPINPRPVAYAQIFRALGQYAIGFITYSEGCNDDFNKVLWSCLGWDPDMKVEDIAKEYSRYFISKRYEDKFARGLFGLERNWVGPLKDNDGVYETLKLFQEMETDATPQDKLNWRFQQGLYRAYYDAYIKARLGYETELEKQAMDVLKNAGQLGSLAAIAKAEAILDKAVVEKIKPQWRARVFELAEALFQSIRMQKSVKKYYSQRYGNLDNIDKPLNNSKSLKKDFAKIRKMTSEQQRLAKIKEITTAYSDQLAASAKKVSGATWPDWRVEFDKYQRKRSGLYKPFSAEGGGKAKGVKVK